MVSADEEDVLNIIPATNLKQEKHIKLKQKHGTNANTLAVVGLNGYIYKIPSNFVSYTQTKPTISYSRQKVADICVKLPPESSQRETPQDVAPSSLSNHGYKVDLENDNSQSGTAELKEDENGIKKKRKKDHENVRKHSPKKKKKKIKLKTKKVKKATKAKHGKKKGSKKPKEVTKKKKKRKRNRSNEFSSLEEEESALKLRVVLESVDAKERKKRHKKERSRSPSLSVELKKKKIVDTEDINVNEIFANGHASPSDHPSSLTGVDTNIKTLSNSFIFEPENIADSVNDIERRLAVLDDYKSDNSEVGSNSFCKTVLDSNLKDVVSKSTKPAEDQAASSPEKYDPFQCVDADIFNDATQSEELSNLSEIYNANDSSFSELHFTKNDVKDIDVVSTLTPIQIARGALSCSSYSCDESVTTINHEIDEKHSAPTKITIETQHHISEFDEGTLLENGHEDTTLSSKAEEDIGPIDENLCIDNSHFEESSLVGALQSKCLTSPQTCIRLLELSSPPTLPPPSEIPLPEQSVNKHELLELCAIPVPQVPKNDLKKKMNPLLSKTQKSRVDLTELSNIKLPHSGKKETRISPWMPGSNSPSAELPIFDAVQSSSNMTLTMSDPIRMNIHPVKEPVRIKFALKTLPSRISKLIKYQEEEEDTPNSKSEENNSATLDDKNISFDEEPTNSVSANDLDLTCDEVSANVDISDKQNTCENFVSTAEPMDKLEDPCSLSSSVNSKEDKGEQLDESAKDLHFQMSEAIVTAKPLDESTDHFAHRTTLSRSRSPRKASRSRSPYRKQRSRSPRSKRSWSPRKRSISRSPLRRSHSRSPTKRSPLRNSPHRRVHSPKRYRHASPKNRRRSSPRKGSLSIYHKRSSSPKRHRSPGRRSPQRRTHKRPSPQRGFIRELSPRNSPLEKGIRRSPYLERAASPKTKRWSPKRVFRPVSPIIEPQSPAQLYRHPSPVPNYHPIPVLKEVPIEDRVPEFINLQPSAIETITSIERQEVIPRPRKEAIHNTVLITIEPQAIPLPEPQTSPTIPHGEEMEISSVSSEEIEPERRMSLDERLKVELGVGEEEHAPSIPLGGGGWNFNEPKQFSREGSELIRHYMEELEKYYATLRNYGGYADYPPPVTLVRVDNTLRIIPTVPVNLSSQTTTQVPTKPALANCRLTGNTGQAKRVVFADNVRPGEGTSPSCGEDMASPPPPLRKRKRRKKKTPSPPDDNIDDLKAELASPPPPPLDLPFSQFVKNPLSTKFIVSPLESSTSSSMSLQSPIMPQPVQPTLKSEQILMNLNIFTDKN